jgi:hypothetical protein
MWVTKVPALVFVCGPKVTFNGLAFPPPPPRRPALYVHTVYLLLLIAKRTLVSLHSLKGKIPRGFFFSLCGNFHFATSKETLSVVLVKNSPKTLDPKTFVPEIKFKAEARKRVWK